MWPPHLATAPNFTEGKGSSSARGAVIAGMMGATEIMDFVGAVYAAIDPKHKKKGANFAEQFDAVVKAVRSNDVNWVHAALSVGYDQTVDKIVGGTLGKANQVFDSLISDNRAIGGAVRGIANAGIRLVNYVSEDGSGGYVETIRPPKQRRGNGTGYFQNFAASRF